MTTMRKKSLSLMITLGMIINSCNVQSVQAMDKIPGGKISVVLLAAALGSCIWFRDAILKKAGWRSEETSAVTPVNPNALDAGNPGLDLTSSKLDTSKETTTPPNVGSKSDDKKVSPESDKKTKDKEPNPNLKKQK
jgi:hypothetical protein